MADMAYVFAKTIPGILMKPIPAIFDKAWKCKMFFFLLNSTKWSAIWVLIVGVLDKCLAVNMPHKSKVSSRPTEYHTVQPIKFSKQMLSDNLLCTTKNSLAFAGRRRKEHQLKQSDNMVSVPLVSPPMII